MLTTPRRQNIACVTRGLGSIPFYASMRPLAYIYWRNSIDKWTFHLTISALILSQASEIPIIRLYPPISAQQLKPKRRDDKEPLDIHEVVA